MGMRVHTMHPSWSGQRTTNQQPPIPRPAERGPSHMKRIGLSAIALRALLPTVRLTPRPMVSRTGHALSLGSCRLDTGMHSYILQDLPTNSIPLMGELSSGLAVL